MSGKMLKKIDEQTLFYFSKHKIVYIGNGRPRIEWMDQDNTEFVSSINFLTSILYRWMPELIVFDSLERADIPLLRQNEKLARVPVLILQHDFDNVNDLSGFEIFPRLFFCNYAVSSSLDFALHLLKIIEKKSFLLPSSTGFLVKKTIVYMNKNKDKKISRQSLADNAGVTDDYLGKIFKSETGLHMWTYLNIYRMDLACKLVLETGLSINEISRRTGFIDPSYFTRVFRQFYGSTPASLRKKN